jgi:hypothetical protein
MIPNELSADAAALVDRLLAVSVGSTVTYADMSAAIGRDVRHCRHVAHAAFRVLRRDGVIFAAVRGVGYRRLETGRIIETVGRDARRSIGRKASRASKALTAATRGINDLLPEQQRRLAAEVSALGLLAHLSRETTVAPKDTHPTKPTPVAVTARRLLLGDAG